jgi:hypothetical protein
MSGRRGRRATKYPGIILNNFLVHQQHPAAGWLLVSRAERRYIQRARSLILSYRARAREIL